MASAPEAPKGVGPLFEDEEDVPEGPRPPKAYKNQAFLNSHEGRLIRVMCELQEPGHRLDECNVENIVMFFGSSKGKSKAQYDAALAQAKAAAAANPSDRAAEFNLQQLKKQAFLVPYFEVTRELARMLTEWSDARAEEGLNTYVVGTGGGPGLHEAANKGAWQAKGPSIGFGISQRNEDGLNRYVTPELAFEFHYFFTRKFWMTYKCMGLVLSPGGFGTCDELFELLNLVQNGKIKRKLPVILIGKEFWQECINWKAFQKFGMITEADMKLLHFVDTAEEGLSALTKAIENVEMKEAGMPSKKGLAQDWLLHQQVTKLANAAETGVRTNKYVVVIVGPSGVGKSTLIKRLMQDYEGKFGFSVSHTTRQPRPGEEDGIHYNFTDKDQMRKSIAKGAFIEHAEVHGNIYGTSFDAVQRVVSKGQVCLLDIDVQGAQQMQMSTLNSITAYLFIGPPSLDTLEERLRSRGTETDEKITLRLANARQECQFAKENPDFFGRTLVNDDLDRAYAEFKEFIELMCGR
mmetsp:Transcript_24504/g.53306  ORF Transcript_24504/g.53306 Transcript_24504/m.53306 type:complete len:521 (-) Transcript_24504:116-1678(-)